MFNILTTKKAAIGTIINFLEVMLAGAVIIAVIFYSVNATFSFVWYDWSQLDTFQQVLNTVLIVVLGLELARLLIIHNIYSIGNLLTFVVARKALKPELTAVDLLLISIAFAILFLLNAKFNGRSKKAKSKDVSLHRS